MTRKIVIAILLLVTMTAYGRDEIETNERWQSLVLAAVDSFPQRGGYYTGSKPKPEFPKTAWRALNEAYDMGPADRSPIFHQNLATPSFCSIATYAVLIKALTMWDTAHVISHEAWVNMKPRVGIADALNPDGYSQDDGQGFWGRCNANGPAIAALVHELQAGYSFMAYRGAKSEINRESDEERYLTDLEWANQEAWNKARPGDIMKIFWNRNDSHGSDCGAIMGDDGVKDHDQERGHSVVFMGYTDGGEVIYWSSNGPGKNPVELGYGIATCNKNKIQRVVFTRITRPEAFDKVKKMNPTKFNKWLQSLNGKHHGTTAELKKYCGIK